jgi:type II secretory pathway component PulK
MRHSLHGRRRGAVLIVTLVCLVIVMALVGTMLVSAIRSGRQWKVERDLVQCELLLQAGVDRAAARLAANPAEYEGEKLEITADEIGSGSAGQVTIEIARKNGQQPQVRVLAEYPAVSDHSVRRSRTILFTTNPSPSQE